MHLLANKKQQDGAALLLVIMITAIMSIIMTLMLHQSKLHMKLSSFVKHRAKAEMALQSAQTRFVFQLMSTPLHLVGPDYVSDTVIFERLVKNFKGELAAFDNVSVSVQDLGGLVSLLPLDIKSFNQLLIEQGYSSEELLAFHDRLADWQDGDSLTHLEGKEKGDYTGHPFFPSNVVLQSVNELSYLLEEDVFQKIAPFLVLYGSGYMNRQFTPEDLYSAAGIATNTNNKEYTSVSSAEGGHIFPSGRFLIRLSYTDNGVSLDKQFLLIRGLETFQPFFVANEKIF